MGLTCFQESVDSMFHSISQMFSAENNPRDRSIMEESFNFFPVNHDHKIQHEP